MRLLSSLLICGEALALAGACSAPVPTAIPDAAFRVTTFPPDADVSVLVDGQWRNAQAPFVVRSAVQIGEVRVRRPGYLPYTLAQPQGSSLSVELEPDLDQVGVRLATANDADEVMAFAMLYPMRLDREFYGALSQAVTAKAASTGAAELLGLVGPVLLKNESGTIRLDYRAPTSGRTLIGPNPLAPGVADKTAGGERYAVYLLDPTGRPRIVFNRNFEGALSLEHSVGSGGVLVTEESPGTLPDCPNPSYQIVRGVSYRIDQSGIRILELSYRRLDLSGAVLWSVKRKTDDR